MKLSLRRVYAHNRVANPFLSLNSSSVSRSKAALRSLMLAWATGYGALAFATWACWETGLDKSAVKCAYLIIVMIMSLTDSLALSMLFCVVAFLCVDFFFTKPVGTFYIENKQDFSALFMFLSSAVIMTCIGRNLRTLSQVQQAQTHLLDLVHDVVVIRDMNGMVLHWNRGAEAVYGWTGSEAVGTVAHELLRTRYPLPADEIAVALQTDGRWEGELTQSRNDGGEVIIESRWALQFDQTGKPVAILEVGKNITARKHAESALRESQATCLAEAQRLSLTGSFGYDLATGEVFWSEQTFRIYEYDSREFPTVELVLNRVHPDDLAYVREALNRAIASSVDLDLEHRLSMPDGTVKHVRVVARPLHRESLPPRLAGAIMDVSAARHAEHRLHEAHRKLASVSRMTTLSELSASIAHEVRQPLSAIALNGMACTRWLDHCPPQLEEARACMARVANDAGRAVAVVERLRALSAKQPVFSEALAINDILRDVVALVQMDLNASCTSLKLLLAPTLPLVCCDRIELQQVFVNLVTNAVQSMESTDTQSRELSIESYYDQHDRVVVAVTDNGSGIAPECADRLFEPFFTTKPQGMGIGLSICRTIVEAHHGEIWVSNNNRRPGVSFFCAFPIAKRSAGTDPQPSTPMIDSHT